MDATNLVCDSEVTYIRSTIPRCPGEDKNRVPMRNVIPSTTALRTFVAAARHLTFTGAADELFLTQSAVSKQIRTLEESLGVTLFVRVNRGLVLTQLGRIYLDEVSPLLTQLAIASGKLSTLSTAPSSLTLRISAILGDRWLLPRFPRFAQSHADVDVQFTSLLSRDRTQETEPDGAFMYGEGVWPGCISDYLFGRRMVLVASPSLLDRIPLTSLDAITQCPLLKHFEVPYAWDEFCSEHGLALPQQIHFIRYEFYSTMLKAAIAGMGMALVPIVYAQEELQRGELVNPLQLGCTSKYGYYFVLPERRQNDPALAVFRSWLLQEAQETRTALAGPGVAHDAVCVDTY